MAEENLRLESLFNHKTWGGGMKSPGVQEYYGLEL